MTPDPFDLDYAEAREHFLELAGMAGANCGSERHPDARAPDGTPLYVDHAWLGPRDASTLVLSLSGTHGDEGPCGSAVQRTWLAREAQRALPPGVAVLCVHAVNPFGCAWGVRVNECNVDLNRNWIDFAAPPPANPLYDEFHAGLPTDLEPTPALVAAWCRHYEAFYARHGDWAASDAISRGQYAHADGLQYGGGEPQWSQVVLTELLAGLGARARHVVYLDWHSLVRSGDGRLLFLCFNETGDPLFRRAASWWGEQALDRRAVDAAWAEGIARSARRPTRCGLQMWGVQHVVAPRADVAGAVIELCAAPDERYAGLEAEVRLTLGQRYLHRSRDATSALARRIRADIREGACPSHSGFRERTLAAALDAHRRALEGAAAWAAQDPAPAPGRLIRHGASA